MPDWITGPWDHDPRSSCRQTLNHLSQPGTPGIGVLFGSDAKLAGFREMSNCPDNLCALLCAFSSVHCSVTETT